MRERILSSPENDHLRREFAMRLETAPDAGEALEDSRDKPQFAGKVHINRRLTPTRLGRFRSLIGLKSPVVHSCWYGSWQKKAPIVVRRLPYHRMDQPRYPVYPAIDEVAARNDNGQEQTCT